MSLSPLGSIKAPAVRVGSPTIRGSPARGTAFDYRSDRVSFRVRNLRQYRMIGQI